MKSLKAALCLFTAILLADPAFATSPTSLAITPGSGSAACVFSVTGSYLAPCVVMVDPVTGVAIVTAAGTSATSALGVQGVTGGTALPISGNVALTGQGVGAITVVPAGTTNGTALGTLPGTATRARIYIPPGGSVTFTIAATAPSSAPSAVVTLTNNGTYMTNWDEYLSGEMIYVTAMSGGCLFRWI
jgi:hypothetical protein